MTTETQELRQAINKLDITGVVKESKLNAGKGDKGNYINGSLIVKAGEHTEIEIKVFVNEKSSTGKVRRVYSTLQQFLDGEVKTLADGVPEEEAVKVRVWGSDEFTPQFREEMYVTENNKNEVTTRISFDLGFGNVTIDNRIKPEDYKATFDVEMFVNSVEEELSNDEPTGRAIVKGFVPVYGGSVIPLEIIAGVVEDEDGKFDFGEEVLNEIQEGDTVRFWGDINYRVIISKRKIGGKLGRAKTEERRTYVNELLAVGGDLIDEPEKEFDEELIRLALTERENKKQEVLEKSKEESKENKKGRGSVGKGRSTRTRTQRRSKNENNDESLDFDDDDIPF